MNKMTLGGVTFTYNPKINFPAIKPKKDSSIVDTYGGVVYFSWVPSIKGVIIPLEWDWMPTAQFSSLDTLYQADNVIVFDPSGGTQGAITYDVVVTKFDGVYWLNMDSGNSYMEKVKMELVIVDQN